jgi:UDP-glucose:(heptosyl)LPS alpha-1,3-glucosyltransferase
MRLLDAGHEVHYVAAQVMPYDHPRLHLHRVARWRFPPSLRVSSFDRGVQRILARLPVDLVHGFSKTSRQDVYTDGSGTLREYIAAQWSHRPRWWRDVYGWTPHQRAIRKLERQRFQRGAILRIVAMAEFVRDQILAEYPVDARRIEVLYNGVETRTFHPANRARLGQALRSRAQIPPDAQVWVFAGNDWRRKGLATALAALAVARRRAPQRDVRLLVAGADNHPRHYLRLAHRRQVAGAVTWLGSVPSIQDVFAAGDVFVFPSRYDVFGNVGLEALASGLPVVLSARAGVSELLAPQRAGAWAAAGAVLDDPEDAEQLARSCEELLDPMRLAARASAARALAESYSWERHFERLLQIYREVVAEKRSSAAPP